MCITYVTLLLVTHMNDEHTDKGQDVENAEQQVPEPSSVVMTFLWISWKEPGASQGKGQSGYEVTKHRDDVDNDKLGQSNRIPIQGIVEMEPPNEQSWNNAQDEWNNGDEFQSHPTEKRSTEWSPGLTI